MDCSFCPALCASRSNIVLPDMPEFGRACEILVIGEAPGAGEDVQAKGFVGRAGRTLHRLLEEQGFQRGYHYGCANIVRCRPPGNRKPTAEEVWNCLPFLAETIQKYRPKAILLVGSTATGVFCGTGQLQPRIGELQKNGNSVDIALVHPLLRDILGSPFAPKLFAIPHTSPLAWNRNAPDGRKWSAIGKEQIGLLGNFLRKGVG